VIDNCRSQLDAWSRNTIKGSLGKAFDPTDSRMMDAYQKHRQAADEYWLTHLSDDIQPKFYKS
jgi:hypothetical protein